MTRRTWIYISSSFVKWPIPPRILGVSLAAQARDQNKRRFQDPNLKNRCSEIPRAHVVERIEFYNSVIPDLCIGEISSHPLTMLRTSESPSISEARMRVMLQSIATRCLRYCRYRSISPDNIHVAALFCGWISADHGFDRQQWRRHKYKEDSIPALVA